MLKINDIDVHSLYGVNLADGARTAITPPAELKPMVENSSRLEDGKRIVTKYPLEGATRHFVQSRELTIPMFITASSESQFEARREAFYNILYKGVLKIETDLLPNKTLNVIYKSCTQFTNFRGIMARFSLVVIEPNPMKRKDEEEE